MICKKCGNDSLGNWGGVCQRCYRYFKDGGKEYPLPPVGEIRRGENGKVVCHICGRAFSKLGSHVNQVHDMTIREYKDKFSLCHRSKTTDRAYSEKMHKHNLENSMDKKILEYGMSTRIKKGDKLRKGKKGTIQESLMKSNRKIYRGA